MQDTSNAHLVTEEDLEKLIRFLINLVGTTEEALISKLKI
jgi:hypothetical protein